MDNFDLKNYLKNNLLKESLEEAKETEEVKEEVKTEGYGKMKKSELKEKIREEILEALSAENDDPTVGDEEEAHSGVAEAEEDEEDIDIDAEVDVEPEMDEPAMDAAAEEDEFAGGEEVESIDQVRDTAIPAWKSIGKAGQAANDEALIKMASDGLKYTENSYPDPNPFDEQ